jgi:Domain of unknown function (DUF4190)
LISMTNPDEDAGQTASSDSSSGASEPAAGGYEAPSIERSQEQPGQPEAPQPAEQPTYTPPPAYTPPPVYDAPSYPQQPGYPSYPPPDYSQPAEYPAPGGAQPGYPPPPYPGPPGYGAPAYPPPQYGTPQYGAPGYPPPPAGYGPPPTGYPAAPDYSAYGPPAQKTNSLAIASLVASLVGFLCWLGSIAGIVLGIVAMNQIKQTREDGHGLAVAGIAIGAVSLIVGLIFFVLALSS